MAELEGYEDDDDVQMPTSVRSAPVLEPLSQPAAGCEDKSCAGEGFLSIIDERIGNYTKAERNCKESGDNIRARRYARGLATLTDLRKKVLMGKAINEDDIPPAITVMPVVKPPSPPETQEPQRETPAAPNVEVTKTFSANPYLTKLRERKQECAKIAIIAKKEGDLAKASAGLRAAKECDSLISQLEKGEIDKVDKLPEIQNMEPKPAPPAAAQRQFSRDDPIQIPESIKKPEDIPPPDPSSVGAPPPPSTVMEALEQRLARYRQDEASAVKENNPSRARRLGRICKQYETAIRTHKAGRPIPVDELPTPPGFAPIPASDARPVKSASTSALPSATAGGAAAAAAAAAPASATLKPSPASGATPSPKAPSTAPKPVTKTPPKDKQLAFLEQQQNLFKQAALEAKKTGQMDTAKEYLRAMKGFDKVIEAHKCGLPVDLKTLPVPPQRKRGNFGIYLQVFSGLK